MKKAFTLVELIIVIGIIGILAGVLLSTFGSSKESALSAHCLSNMKNLANAASSYALENGGLPTALSSETCKPDVSEGYTQAKLMYYEHPGWISWYSKGLYDEKHKASASQKKSCKVVSLYSDVLEDVQFALQNGSLYKYTSGNMSTYLCPKHKSKFASAHWSYFMNPRADGAGYGEKIAVADGRSVGSEHVLLFAEVPFTGPGIWFPSGASGNDETDAAIQYTKENIGCNHKSGKYWVAHVVFCDGHVEKLRAPGATGSSSASNLKEVTEWLCEGYDVAFSSGAYEKIAGADQADQGE